MSEKPEKTIPITLRVTRDIHSRIKRVVKANDMRYHGKIMYMLKLALIQELEKQEQSLSPISATRSKLNPTTPTDLPPDPFEIDND